MTVEQAVAIIGALTALLVAVGGVLVQVSRTHALVNSRMTELLALTRSSAIAEGANAATRVAPVAQVQPSPPTA